MSRTSEAHLVSTLRCAELSIRHYLATPDLHALVIGPGLGREPAVLEAVMRIIEKAKVRQLPLVLDADGLWLLTQQPDLLRGYHAAVVNVKIEG